MDKKTGCHSIVAHISDEWCINVNCAPIYSDYCRDGPSGTLTPTVAPTKSPTLMPIATPTVPTASSSPTMPKATYKGLYEFTWDSITAIPPSGVNLAVAFSGWANIDSAIYESGLVTLPAGSEKYISIGGGNQNGYLTPASVDELNLAIQDGRLNSYEGICYDIEKGDSGMAAVFSESFALAKNHGFKVLVTISHSAPYGFSDKVQLMNHFFQDTNIDIISPQLYTSGWEEANDYVYDGVPWSSYGNSIAKIVPSIVSSSYYDDAQDYFNTPSRSGIPNGLQIAGYIQWKQL